MKKLIRKWLGIADNEERLDLQTERMDIISKRVSNSASQIGANQSKIDRIGRNYKKN